MTPHRRGLSNRTAGAIALVVTLACTYLGFTKALPFRDHFEVKAAFRSSLGLKPGTAVRIAGTSVGKVSRVERAADGTAVVWLRLTDTGLPLHTDARAKVRPRLFFEGNFFVDLSPGSPAAPRLRDDGVIPVTQTATAVQFDQALSVLDQTSRSDLSTILREYGGAVKTSGRAVNQTIPYYEPAYRDSAIVADAQQGERSGQLSEFLAAAGTVSAALDRDPAALQSLLADLRATAGAFADESVSLEDTLRELPELLRVGMPALADLNAAFPPLRRLVGDLREAVRTAPPALDAQIALAQELRDLVRPQELRGLARVLRGAAPSLARLNRRSLPLSEQGRALSSCQAGVVLPWTRDTVPDAALPAAGRVFQEFPYTLPGLAGESRTNDANGDYIRVQVTTGTKSYQLGTGQFLQTALPLEGVNPPRPARVSPLRPDVACETQSPPDLRTNPGAPPPEVTFDTTSPAARERYEKAQAEAVRALRKDLRLTGLSDSISVSDQELTPSQVGQAGR